jgi:hypothetical protein
MHQDVHIKLFRYSLEGIARDWCQSLPVSSISSLTGFHVAFNLFCEKKFSAESLFENCCLEYAMSCKSYHIEGLACDINIHVLEHIQ